MLKKMLLTTAFGVGLIAAATIAQAAQTLVVSAYAPYAHWSISEGMETWAKEVAAASKGQIKIDVLKTSLGKPEAHYDMARDGIADIIVTVPGYTPGRFVLVEVAGVPNVGNTGRGLSIALWRMYAKYPEMQKEFEDVKVLGFWTTSPILFYNNKRPITKMDDFKGLKIRAAGGVMGEAVSALGAVPVNQPAGKAFELLSSGVLDGVVFPKETVVSFKLDRVLKYATIIPGGLSAAPVIVAMNKAKFDKLSKADQEALMSVSGERIAQIVGPLWDKYGDAGMAAIKAAGGEVATASPELSKQIGAALEPVVAGWIKDAKEKRSFDGAKLLADYRAEIKKVEASN